jgi:hypothetical protein
MIPSEARRRGKGETHVAELEDVVGQQALDHHEVVEPLRHEVEPPFGGQPGHEVRQRPCLTCLLVLQQKRVQLAPLLALHRFEFQSNLVWDWIKPVSTNFVFQFQL